MTEFSETEEFYAEVWHDHQWSERFVVVTPTDLEEIDASTAVALLRLPLRQLTSAVVSDDVPEPNERPERKESGQTDETPQSPTLEDRVEVQLHFRTTLRDRDEELQRRYVLESETHRKLFLQLLEPFLLSAALTQRTATCLQCSAVVPLGTERCPTCGSDFVVQVTEEMGTSPPPPETPTKPPSDNSSDASDMNLQLFLRLNIFTGGASEKLVSFFKTNFLRYGVDQDERLPLSLLR